MTPGLDTAKVLDMTTTQTTDPALIDTTTTTTFSVEVTTAPDAATGWMPWMVGLNVAGALDVVAALNDNPQWTGARAVATTTTTTRRTVS